MFTPDPQKAYQLVEVTNLDGTAKNSRALFYEERLGCIGHLQLQTDTNPKNACLFAHFCRTAQGNRTNLQLRTSPLFDIECNDGILQATTYHSIYYFEETTLPVSTHLQEKNLIDLYLTDTGDHFCEGTLYDGDGIPHTLHCLAHEGLFEDSYLLYERLPDFVCRYFTDLLGLCFYKAPPSRFAALLLHNESVKPLRIRFQGIREEVILAAGQQVRIDNPFQE